MGIEIERKWLVGELPEGLLATASSTPIRQGYLASSEAGEVRIRRRAGETTLTVKHGKGLLRGETDIPIDPTLFDQLWPQTEGRRVTKVRHVLPMDGALIAEIDIYEDQHAGLRIVEVEFPDAESAARFVPRAWMAVEVTEDERFKNKALAVADAPPARI